MKNLMEKIQQRVSTTSIRFVSPPYLPSGLIWAALLVTFTDLMVILLGQPAAYWIDRSRAESSIPFLKSLLSTGVLSYILVGIVYLILIWAILTILTRSIALAVWMPVTFVHLTHSLSWIIEKSKLMDVTAWSQIINITINALAALTLGIILARILLNPRKPDSEPTRFQRWIKPVLLIVWVLTLISAVSVSAFGRRGGWVLLKPLHSPGQRGISAVTYDSARQKVVLFGGVSDWLGSSFLHMNDTWEWDGKDWIEMHPKTLPPVRAGQMMAFDEKRGVVVMFSGEDKSEMYMLSDTWEWDGKDWKQMSPKFSPQGRRGGQLFYDPKTEKIILTGGFYYSPPNKTFTSLNDTWEWDGKNWTMVANISENIVITNPNVAYDPLQERTVLFNFNKIMTWENEQWNEIVVDKKPSPRFGTWLAADLENGRMLMFGGINNNVQMNDTWLLNGNVWTDLQPDLAPSPRDAHVMFYDPARKSFILYGGISSYALDDMWEYVFP